MYISEIISYNEVFFFPFGHKKEKEKKIIGFDKKFKINNIINPNITSFVSYVGWQWQWVITLKFKVETLIKNYMWSMVLVDCKIDIVCT